jgi:acyl-CoA thioesterase II
VSILSILILFPRTALFRLSQPHSIKTSFPVVYSVESTRDGRSFCNRTVRASQRGSIAFVLTASFHRSYPSSLGHGITYPVDIVARPETITAQLSDDYAKEIYQDILKASEPSKSDRSVPPAVAWVRENGLHWLKIVSEDLAKRPIDFRYVPNDQLKRTSSPAEYRQYIWFKANGPISNDKNTNAVGLVYASDHNLADTTILSHEDRSNEDGSNLGDIHTILSLDHVMYFHHVC